MISKENIKAFIYKKTAIQSHACWFIDFTVGQYKVYFNLVYKKKRWPVNFNHTIIKTNEISSI